MCRDIRVLKLEYLDRKELLQPLAEEMGALFSSNALKKYKEIMHQNGIPKLQLGWLDTAAKEMDKALENSIPLSKLVERLQRTYEKKFLE